MVTDIASHGNCYHYGNEHHLTGTKAGCETVLKKGGLKDILKQLHSTNLDHQEPTETMKQPMRTRYLGHVTDYQPIRVQYFLIRLVPVTNTPPIRCTC
eukprot:sb/3478897/